MDRFHLSITHQDSRTENFEVAEYLHHSDTHCKFEIFQNGKLIASLEPDKNEYLHVCKNPGGIDYETLHLIIHKLESYNL
ncbi:hypothetical protein GS399_04415 [Pedobacter sp. HMF7647]|uniref:Uncharacterized protein n=1 Tax=Hufsiella arboris TaxID=2695275 RepID=A0A7K1Y6K2_9SPHI|nr:hypothetical protein [Hufsiella arboris]MXV50204.1 hypothetical protein [Hufsiella arboris]